MLSMTVKLNFFLQLHTDPIDFMLSMAYLNPWSKEFLDYLELLKNLQCFDFRTGALNPRNPQPGNETWIPIIAL